MLPIRGFPRRTGAARARLLAAAATLLTAHIAGAQDPAPPNVTGRVTTIGGVPVSGIEVTIEGTAFTTRTDTRGAFVFIGAPGGTQDLVLRGIGYLPTRQPVRIPERSLDLKVTMLAAPALLDTVKVRERINVLSGVVVDERDQPVPGATIEVITGDKQTLTTGDDGWFILTAVREGVVVFRTRKEGYYLTNTAVRMHEWRGVVVHLETLDEKLSDTRKADAAGTSNIAQAAWKDASMRLAMKGSRAVVVSEEELTPFGGMSLSEALKFTRGGSQLAFELQSASGSICVLLDGRRAIGSTTLDAWRASDVEMLELYPPGSESSGTVARYLRAAGCRTVATTGMRSRGPFYAVLWTK
jgi:hypothetical protein